MKHALLAAAALAAAAPASAAQLLLTGANVVGVNSTYYGGTGQNGIPFATSIRVTGQFGAGNIFGSPAGTISEPGQSGYWISGDNNYYPGVAVATITVDLGAAYALTGFDLFNTHNSFYNDRGTGDFEILGANAVADDGANGLTLSGPLSTLTSGTLAAVAQGSPIPGQSFAASGTGGYRYIEFRALSVAASGTAVANPGTSGSIAYGLNELRVFGDLAPPPVGAVPEPATWASMVLGFALVGRAVRRRRTSPAAA